MAADLLVLDQAVLAQSAQIAAGRRPPPAGQGGSLPSRLHTPLPGLNLLDLLQVDIANRQDVLHAIAHHTLTVADAAEVHLTNPALDEALLRE
ncbi:hypothetical protein [Streptomyces chartreusis]|uniref:hypothetical protein n=1 Tax=Streptomyces chartreusis TaxID=1969 RepID=UPI0037AB20C2